MVENNFTLLNSLWFGVAALMRQGMSHKTLQDCCIVIADKKNIEPSGIYLDQDKRYKHWVSMRDFIHSLKNHLETSWLK